MKKIAVAFILIMALSFGGVLYIFRTNVPPEPDMLNINSAIMNAMQVDDEAEALRLLSDVLTREAELIEASAHQRNATMQILIITLLCSIIIAIGGLLFYIDRTILRPFRNLETFASRVAQGDLSFQLEMDRENRF